MATIATLCAPSLDGSGCPSLNWREGGASMNVLPMPQEPIWSKIAPVVVTGPAVRITPGSIAIPTSEGECLVTAHDDGVRLRFGRRDLPEYPILIAEPEEQVASFIDGEAA